MVDIAHLQKQLANATEQINTSCNNSEINQMVENIITQSTQAEFASVWMYDATQLIRERNNEIKKISMKSKEGLLYKCFATKQAAIYNYITSEKGYVAAIDNPDEIKIKSKIMIPLLMSGKFVGIITAYASVRKIKNFGNDDLEILKAISPFVTDAINRMRINNGKDVVVDRREKKSKDSGQRRRKDDVSENLNQFEERHSETKNAQEILDYTANIVHDIRTPANGLMGFLEILEEQIKDERLKEYIGHAKSSASLINDLTTSILDGFSSKRDTSVTGVSIVNTRNFFSEIAEVFSANMYKKEIQYNIFIDPSLPKEIEIDSMKMKRVLMNLLSNAVKFTPVNGTIEFSLRYKKKEKKLHLFVKDSGIGIAKENQADIFKAFKQAEENTKDIYGGTGLGLAICAKYVSEMGGKLLIDSEIDKGSTFYFDMPIQCYKEIPIFEPLENNEIKIGMLLTKKNAFVANHIARYLVKLGMHINDINAVSSLGNLSKNITHLIVFENKLDNEVLSFVAFNKIKLLIVEENFLALNENDYANAVVVSQYAYLGKSLYSFASVERAPKVLIVEDDTISIALLKTMLMDEYCTIDTAGSGEQGLELLTKSLENNQPYDIVYSDQNMGKLSGTQMLKEYYELEKAQGLEPLASVCISGDHGDKVKLDGFKYFASKPFKKQEIISIFLDTIKQKRSK
jgi:signal transduction histidine kinase